MAGSDNDDEGFTPQGPVMLTRRERKRKARQGEFVEDILDSVGNVIKQDGRALPHSYRDKGKWRSITLKVPVQSAEELYKVYDAIDKDPRVKFKF